MLTDNLVQAAAKFPAPILTVYVNTSEMDSSRHAQPKNRLNWLLDSVGVLKRALSYAESKRCDRQVQRVARFLEKRHPAERSLVIFAGATMWQAIPLQEQVINQVSWGSPQIAPLLASSHSHRRYVAVVIDHKAARFFELCEGRFDLLSTRKLVIDTSEWKHGEQGSVAAERSQKPRGPLRDRYQRRLDARYKVLCHDIAQEAVNLVGREHLSGLFLIGPERLTQLVLEKIPQRLAASTVRIAEDFGGLPPKQCQKRIEPLIEAFEQQQQLAMVKALQREEAGGLVNPDEVLSNLQSGGLRSVLVAKDLNLALRDCPKCALASTSADPVCPNCGTMRRPITLGELIARVWSQRSVPVEFVTGDAADLLRQTGGLGGWRTLKRAATK